MSNGIFVITSPAGQREFRMEKNFITLGRDAVNDIHVDDKFASRKHAQISVSADGSLKVMDLQSHNGIKVNGAKTTEKSLMPGDAIEIGAYRIAFIGPDIPVPQAPAFMPVHQPAQPQHPAPPQQFQPPAQVGQFPAETPVQRMPDTGDEKDIPGASAGTLMKVLIPVVILVLAVVAGLMIKDYMKSTDRKVVSRILKKGEYRQVLIDAYVGKPKVMDTEIVEFKDLNRRTEVGLTGLREGNTDIIFESKTGGTYILRVTVAPADMVVKPVDDMPPEIMSEDQIKAKAGDLLQKGLNSMTNNEFYDANRYFKEAKSLFKKIDAPNELYEAETNYMETEKVLNDRLKELKTRFGSFNSTGDYVQAAEVLKEIQNLYNDPNDLNWIDAENKKKQIKAMIDAKH